MFWASHIGNGATQLQGALQSCRLLQAILEPERLLQVEDQEIIQSVCKAVHEHFVQQFYCAPLAMLGEENILTSYSDLPAHMQTAVTVLNGLAQSYNVRTLKIMISL